MMHLPYLNKILSKRVKGIISVDGTYYYCHFQVTFKSKSKCKFVTTIYAPALFSSNLKLKNLKSTRNFFLKFDRFQMLRMLGFIQLTSAMQWFSNLSQSRLHSKNLLLFSVLGWRWALIVQIFNCSVNVGDDTWGDWGRKMSEEFLEAFNKL
jgi:hypothetical protein